MDRRKTYFLLSIVLMLGLALRLFPIRLDFHYWDETVYLQHAEIIAGESPDNYNEFDFRPPLFSLMLALPVALSDSIALVHVFVALLSTIGVYLVYRMVEDFYGKETGLVAAAIYSFSPILLRLSHDILVDPLLPLFWIATASSLYRSIKTERKAYFILTGVLAALSVLMKFTSLVMVPAIAFVYYFSELEEYDLKKLLQRLKNVLTDFRYWLTGASFLATLSPYLFWSWLSYGSPLFTFFKAISRSGATDAFLTYLNGWHLYILPVFYLGLLGFLLHLRRKRELEELVIVVFTLSLVVPLQFMVGNREWRFLAPIIPFVSAAAAKGVFELKKLDRSRLAVAVLGVFLVLSTALSGSALENRNLVEDGLVKDEWHPAVEEASYWLKNNTESSETVYTIFRYPAIGYYSKRNVEVFQQDVPLDKLIKRYVDGPGYIYYSRESPHTNPTLHDLRTHPHIELRKSFREKVYLFYYEGRQ